MNPIGLLTDLAVVLSIGIITSIISAKLKVPNVLLLLLAGIVIGNFQVNGAPIIAFPEAFLISIGILALAIIVFDASSSLNLRQFDVLSGKAFKLSFIFLILNSIFLTLFTIKIFPKTTVLLGLIFATMMSGTAPSAVITMLQNTKNRLAPLLTIESIINTPLVVLLPFILIDFIKSFEGQFFSKFIEHIGPVLQQFVSGIGAGIVIGIIICRVMKHKYSEKLSPLALITAALLTYILAENLGGNGVLAVTTMGLFFGHVNVTHKVHLMTIASFFASSLEILVFVLVGVIIKFPLQAQFLLAALLLFSGYLLIRYISVSWAYKDMRLTPREKMFITLNAQKGIAVAVVAFTLSTLSIKGLTTILHLTLVFMLYSLTLSTLVLRCSKWFLRKKA